MNTLLLLCLFSAPPAPAINVPCKIVSVHDGDTATVELRIVMHVRFLDYWAPELKDKGGIESRDAIKKYEGKDAVLSVPIGKANSVDDVFTFGRILGYLFVGETSISEEQVQGGFATKTRNK